MNWKYLQSILLYSMIFCHIIADFNLQGCLADLKQEAWWKKHYPDKKYECDYNAALWMHSFAWSFMIHIPIIVVLLCRNIMTVEKSIILSITFWTNHWIHYIVDDMKANNRVINLCQDQLIHVVQVLGTFSIFVFIVKILG